MLRHRRLRFFSPLLLLICIGFFGCSLDLAETDRIRDGIREFLGATERLDLVLLNAGVLAQIKDLRDTSLEEISVVMNVNVWANKLIYDTLLEMQIQVEGRSEALNQRNCTTLDARAHGSSRLPNQEGANHTVRWI